MIWRYPHGLEMNLSTLIIFAILQPKWVYSILSQGKGGNPYLGEVIARALSGPFTSGIPVGNHCNRVPSAWRWQKNPLLATTGCANDRWYWRAFSVRSTTRIIGAFVVPSCSCHCHPFPTFDHTLILDIYSSGLALIKDFIDIYILQEIVVSKSESFHLRIS